MRVLYCALVASLIATPVLAQDLVVSTISGPATATPGSNATVTIGVRNAGNIATPPNTAIQVSIYLSGDQTINTSDDLVVKYNLSIGGNLSAGAGMSANATVTVPSTVTTGARFWGAIVDPSNFISETNETNNAMAGNSVQVGAVLQLTVSPSASQTTTPGGAAVTYSLTVTSGSSAVSGATIAISDGLANTSASVTTNGSGQASYSTSAPTSASASAGSRTVTFQASKAGSQSSSVVSRTIIVVPATLQITVTPSSTQTTTPGGPSITYTITSSDGANAVGGVTIAIGDGVKSNNTSVTTNPSGTVSYTTSASSNVSPGTYSVTFQPSKTGYSTGNTVTRTVVVNPIGQTLTVIVREDDGFAYPTAQAVGQLFNSSGTLVAIGTSAVGNQFVFSGVPSASGYRVDVLKNGVVVGRKSSISVPASGSVIVVNDAFLPTHVAAYQDNDQRGAGNGILVEVLDPAGVVIDAATLVTKSAVGWGWPLLVSGLSSLPRLFESGVGLTKIRPLDKSATSISYTVRLSVQGTVVSTTQVRPLASNTISPVPYLHTVPVTRAAMKQACQTGGAYRIQNRLNPTQTDGVRRIAILVHGFIRNQWNCAEVFQPLRDPDTNPLTGSFDEWQQDYFNAGTSDWNSMASNFQLLGYEVYTFRWPTDLSIQDAGTELRLRAEAQFGRDDRLVLFAHSMGGVVSRVFASTTSMRNVKVITSGTPNFPSSFASGLGCDIAEYLRQANCSSLAVDDIRPGSARSTAMFNTLTSAESQRNAGRPATDHVFAIAGSIIPATHPDPWNVCPVFGPCDGLIEVNSVYGIDGQSTRIHHQIRENGGPLLDYDHGQLKLDGSQKLKLGPVVPLPNGLLATAIGRLATHPKNLTATAQPSGNGTILTLTWQNTTLSVTAGTLVEISTSASTFEASRVRVDTVRTPGTAWTSPVITTLNAATPYFIRVSPIFEFYPTTDLRNRLNDIVSIGEPSPSVSLALPKPLTITGTGTGNGKVTGPGGIDCTITAGVATGTCTASFTDGTSVSLTGAPTTPGHTFGGWSGGCTNASGPCLVTMSAARSVTASFAPAPPVTITTASSPANGGTTSGGGSYASGTSVTVTASQAPGYTFVNWTENGSAVSQSLSYTFNATANRSLTANFSLNPQPATKLGVQTQPVGSVSGAFLPTQPVLRVLTAQNAVVPTATNVVTASLSGGTGTLSGTIAIAAVNGVATFTDLSVIGTGTFTLTFASPGLTSATSASFPIQAPAVLRGDVDDDGQITINDARAILLYAIGGQLPGSYKPVPNGDANCDGTTNALDAQIVLKYINGVAMPQLCVGQRQ